MDNDKHDTVSESGLWDEKYPYITGIFAGLFAGSKVVEPISNYMKDSTLENLKKSKQSALSSLEKEYAGQPDNTVISKSDTTTIEANLPVFIKQGKLAVHFVTGKDMTITQERESIVEYYSEPSLLVEFMDNGVTAASTCLTGAAVGLAVTFGAYKLQKKIKSTFGRKPA